MIAATIVNMAGKVARKAAKATDFIKEPTRILTPDEMERALDGWAAAHNEAVH